MMKSSEEDHNYHKSTESYSNSKSGGDPARLPDGKRIEIVWANVIVFLGLHIAAVYGAYLVFTKAKWQTSVCAYLLYVITMTSVTAGVHRLWAHRTYKAKLPLRVILLFFYTMALQKSVAEWVRDHRMHHKYSDTDADPYNSKRGFFFCHIGWLMIRKHPDIRAKGNTITMNDIWSDPLLRFQHNYYALLAIVSCFVLPSYIPVLWGEEVWIAFYVCACLRYIFTLNVTASVNSVAHMWGTKPYDKNINPVEIKIISFLTAGEGFHNYHHSFPWDYRAAEFGNYALNITKPFIDVMAKIGWAYDLKTVSEEIIQKHVNRTGDGTHPVWGSDKDS